MEKMLLYVLGMHRGGTSALTRVLNLGGARLPDKLMPPVAENNEKGFWEPHKMVLINQRILRALSLDWWSAAPMPPNWEAAPDFSEFGDQITGFVEEELEIQNQLLLKDPRVSRLLPFWLQNSSEATNSVAVLALRHPTAVAASLAKRDRLPEGHAILLWLRHMLEAEYATRGLSRCVVSFDALIKDWRDQTDRINQVLGAAWRGDWSGAESDVDAFLESNLVHWHPQTSSERGDLAELAETAFQAFLNLASCGDEKREPLEILDSVRERLKQFDEVSGPALLHTSHMVARSNLSLKRQEEAHKQENASKEEFLQIIRQRFDALDKRLGEFSHLAGKLGELKQSAETTRSGIDALTGQLAEKDASLAIYKSMADDHKAQSRALRKERDVLQQHFDESQLALQQSQQQKGKLEFELENLAVKLNSSREQQKSQADALRAAEAQLTLLTRETDEQRQKLDSVVDANEAERALVRSQLTTADRALATLTDEKRARARRGTNCGLRPRVDHAAILEATGSIGGDAPWWPICVDGNSGKKRSSAVNSITIARELLRRHWLDPRDYHVPVSRIQAVTPLCRIVLALRADNPQLRFSLFDPRYYGSQLEQQPSGVVAAVAHYLATGHRLGVFPHPLFDPAHYRSQLPASIADQVEPLSHYLTIGWRFGLDPHWAFSVIHYLRQNPDVKKSGVEPLGHYLRDGEVEGRSPHPFFNPHYYLRQVARSGADAPISAVRHFIEEGLGARISTHPLVDPEFLVSRTSSLRNTEANWFRALSENQDCRPNRLFDYRHYDYLHPDVAEAGLCPLSHYLEHGWTERRDPHVLFDAQHYADCCAIGDDEDPLQHYLSRPPRQRLAPHPMFDDKSYRNRYKDIRKVSDRMSPFDHYLLYGSVEKRDPNPDFHARFYLSQLQLPDNTNPLEHYLTRGMRLGLRTRPSKDESTALEVKGEGWRRIAGDAFSDPNAPLVLLVAHSVSNRLFGAERSFLDMVRGAKEGSGSNVVVTLPRSDPQYIELLKPFVEAIFIRSYPWWRDGCALSKPTVTHFEQLIRSESIDLVHVNTIMVREPLYAARRCGVPGLVHVREIIDQDEHLQKVVGLSCRDVVKQVNKLADYVVSNSLATQALFDPDQRGFVIPNTIEIEAFANAVKERRAALIRADAEMVVGMISSNLPKKGIGDFIQLASCCREQLENIRFRLIGPKTDALSDLLRQWPGGVPHNLEVAGYASDPVSAIASIDVLVNFSHFAESFGRTVLEAMAARLPVIVYDHGALPFLVQHEESGFVIPFLAPEAAVPGLKRLANDPNLRQRMGTSGFELGSRFYDTSVYRRKVAETYSTVLYRQAKKTGDTVNDSKLLQHDVAYASIKRATRRLGKPGSEPPRIAYFQWHFPVPSETFVLNELRRLVGAGQDVRVYCKNSPHKEFVPDFDIDWQRVATPEELAQRLKETGRTVVHSHFTYPTVTDMVWPACRLSGAHFTFCAHAQDIFRYSNDEKNRIAEVVSAPECLAVFVPGRFHRTYLLERGVPGEKIIINPQGIDTELYPKAVARSDHSHTTKRLCAVHRFTEKKGLEDVIRAAPKLQAIGVAVDLYGYGELAEQYRALIAELGVTNVAIHEGGVDRAAMIEIFNSHDLFLCPSVRAADGDMDGIPTVLMEAMLSGVPVLSTDVSSIRELVIDEVTGLVCRGGDPDDLAARVEHFYAMSDAAVARMIDKAAEHVRDRFNVDRLLRLTQRVWRQQALDIVIVSWNNLSELREVIERLYRNTLFPFHLIVCDNDSDADLVAYLEAEQARRDNFTLIHKGRNSLVGPGTNTAAAQGNADIVVYVCGKEGFTTQPGWDGAVIQYMSEHRDIGLAGTLCYSPSYLYGKDYPSGVAEWHNFRNQQFAQENPDREFQHVQGGFFAMQRKMLDQIGGFSDSVPHSYTDVEFSYYVESCGWKLGEIPHILALFNKTRPNIEARYDEFVYAVHPPAMQDRKWADDIAERRVRACNICMATWPREQNHADCPECGASDEDRSLYRALAESCLMYRRLPALATGLCGRMAGIWQKSFQGQIVDSYALIEEFRSNPKAQIDHGDGSLSLILLRGCPTNMVEHDSLMAEIRRVLSAAGELWAQWEETSHVNPERKMATRLKAFGFEIVAENVFASSVIGFSAGKLERIVVAQNS